MLKLFFLVFIFFHSLFHVMGFTKAFHLSFGQQLTGTISKPAGLFWLLTAFLFLLTVILFSVNNEYGWLSGLLAVFLSQLLIFLYWKEAKWGSIANLILLFPLLASFGQWWFDQSYKKGKAVLMATVEPVMKEGIDVVKWNKLPLVVQRWLERSGAGKMMVPKQVHIRQKGEMKTSPNGKWIDFAAEQYSLVASPGFIWKTTIHPSSFINLAGTDKLLDGKANMKISLYGLYPIIHSAGPETDQGALLRWLAEISWFPVAALDDCLRWEQLDQRSAKATVRSGNTQASGVFYFTEKGDLEGFEAMRYYIEGKKKPRLEKWEVRTEPGAYKNFNGYRIPYQSSVRWLLKEGEYEWMKLEIVSVDYQ